jgi:3-oxoadipate enol-lactonase
VPAFTTSDGVRLHYELEGTGRPLVMHLGAGADSDLWRAAGYVDALAGSCGCVLFDHRGHGASDHPASPAVNHIDRYADDVVALLHHLGLPSSAFFGWSNGLVVGLRVAQRHPELFDALVLFGGIAPRATREQLEVSTQARLAAIRARGWWSILEDMVAAESRPVPQWFLDRVVATDVRPWLGYTEARPSWDWSPWDAAPLVRCPTLILVGDLEDPEDVMGELAAAMPDARRVRVPDAEHINAFLDSSFAAPVIRDFLATG